MALALPDAVCLDCGAPLSIIDEDPGFVTAGCLSCGTSYGFEPVSADDGTITYWPAFRIALTGEATTL